jgi:hypothetical protein
MSPSEAIEKMKSFDVERAIELAATSQDFLLSVAKANRMQLKMGLKSDGERIGKYRSKPYAEKKNSMNGLAGMGNVDLILTGAFEKGIFAQSEGDTLEIGSTDTKTEMLTTKYGEEIFGLMDDSIQDVTPILQKEFNKIAENEAPLA